MALETMPSPEDVAGFSRDGFLILEQILTPDEQGEILEAMNRIYAGNYTDDRRPPALRGKVIDPFGTVSSTRWILNARILDGRLWDLVTSVRLGQAAATLLGTRSVSLVEDQLLDKPPDGAPVNVHQDYPYWPFSTSTQMITCWIALVEMTCEMGPVEILRGSHTWGVSQRPKELIRGSDEGWLAAVESMPGAQERDFVSVTVPAGGGAFFHGLTFHGSRSNQTRRTRRACSLHWASAECRLDRSKLIDHDYPYFFSGLRDGDPLVNQYIPQVYPRDTASPVPRPTPAGRRVAASHA